jgi:dTDP-4-amino-4,6-dideoxy-D-galactose acyltransferase
MQINAVESLEWDSNFFGYPVARVILDREGEDKLDDLFKRIALEDFRLTYFFVPPAEKGLNNFVSGKGALFVDQKVIFTKLAENHKMISERISEFQGVTANEKLKRLALQAGLYSRFRTDNNFVSNEYERLYLEWLAKSISKEIALKIFVAIWDYEIIGLTTLGEKQNHADIGLVSVDRNFRGQGLGRDLVKFADTAAFNLGFKEIKVATQMVNRPAFILYEKCNFHIEEITNIYHYWQS